ncbi:MAG: GxxExxY protein [Thermoplasmatota archaeon]|nr:GxxExxY protein [Halobacteriales archaeon]
MENDPVTQAIIGAAIEVHRRLGCGFLERVYQEAFSIELETQGIPFRREVEAPIEYRGRRLPCGYRLDFLCHGRVVVEAKASDGYSSRDISQLLNYLKAGPYPLGLLINFGSERIQIRRLAN